MENEILKLTNDLVFKQFFTYNNDYSLLNEFVSLVIGRKLEDIQVINPEINDEDLAGKQIVMDLRIRTSDSLVNVEMQSYSQSDYIDRSLLYSTRHFTNNNLKCGDGYIKLSPAYTINILKHKLFSCSEYKSEFEFKECSRNENLSDKLKIFFLELSKVSKDQIDKEIISNPSKNCDKLLLWMLLFKCEKKGDLDMFYTTNYLTMHNAANRLETISEDEITRVRAEMREKAQADYASAMANQRAEGEAFGAMLMASKLCHSKKELLEAVEYTEQECNTFFNQHPEIKPSYWD